MKSLLETIGRQFRLSGVFLYSELLQNGGIHETYRVTYQNPDGTRQSYIFQKVNRTAFQNPEAIMQNISAVTAYFRNNFPDMKILEFYQTENHAYLYKDFRVMNAIQGKTMRTCDSLMQIREAGIIFGQFHAKLSGLDGTKLNQTIPDFHATQKYMQKLQDYKNVVPELKILQSMQEQTCEIVRLYQTGVLPFRIVHNDMKCSNILFDNTTGKALAVIDWDTIMNGMLVYDFGDAVRSLASKTVSDNPDLSAVGIDLQKFQAFADGYLQETRNFLTQKEKSVLVKAVFTVTAELAVRYLLDYLQGSLYFKISYPEHNLIKARNQIQLAKHISANSKAMQEMILKFI